jgi:hypothetical protein
MLTSGGSYLNELLTAYAPRLRMLENGSLDELTANTTPATRARFSQSFYSYRVLVGLYRLKSIRTRSRKIMKNPLSKIF